VSVSDTANERDAAVVVEAHVEGHEPLLPVEDLTTSEQNGWPGASPAGQTPSSRKDTAAALHRGKNGRQVTEEAALNLASDIEAANRSNP
jgi:hypothetical protein